MTALPVSLASVVVIWVGRLRFETGASAVAGWGTETRGTRKEGIRGRSSMATGRKTREAGITQRHGTPVASWALETYVNIEFRRLDDVDDPGRVSPEVQACHMPDWHVDEERPEFDAAIPDSIIPRSAW